MKVARILKRNEEETFALVNNEGQKRLILRAEIQKQKGLDLPDDKTMGFPDT